MNTKCCCFWLVILAEKLSLLKLSKSNITMWIAWPAKYLYQGMLVRISVQTSVNLHAVLLAVCYTYTFTVCNANHYRRGENNCWSHDVLKCVSYSQLSSCQEAFAIQTWPHHHNSTLICNNSNGLLHALVHRPLWPVTLWICIVTIVFSAPLTQDLISVPSMKDESTCI